MHFPFAADTFLFVGSVDDTSGEVKYVVPGTGNFVEIISPLLLLLLLESKFDVWSGCFAASDVALVVCVAINDYHGVSNYIWSCNGQRIENRSPLHYCTSTGTYTCLVSCEQYSATATFDVECDSEGKFTMSGRMYYNYYWVHAGCEFSVKMTNLKKEETNLLVSSGKTTIISDYFSLIITLEIPQTSHPLVWKR